MFEWKEKASNAILLDDNVGGKGKCFRAKFLQPGLVKYSFGVCLLDKMTIDRFAYQFEGCPVIIDHKDVTTESAKDDRVGVIAKVWFNECDSWYWCEGVIFEQEALDLIDKGYNVSCQYEITEYSENRENKLHNGNEYDKTILNGRPEHLAIVKNPRYENAMIAVNALDLTAENGGEGSGIKGHHTNRPIPLLKEDIKKLRVRLEQLKSYDCSDSEEHANANKQAQEKTLQQIKELEDIIKSKKETAKNDIMSVMNEVKAEIMYAINEDKKEFVTVGEGDSAHAIPVDYLKKDKKENKQEGGNEEEKQEQYRKIKYNNEQKSLDDLVLEHDFKPIKQGYRYAIYKGDAYAKITPDEYNNLMKLHRDKQKLSRLPKKYKIKKAPKEYGDNQYGLYKNGELVAHSDDIFKLKKHLAETERKDKKQESTQLKLFSKNDIIQAINEIKELDMFKSLFKKKETKMDKEEMKALFMECLTELTAANEAEKKEEVKEEEKEAENKCKNEEPDYKKLYEDLKAKMEAANEEKDEKAEDKKEAKNSIDEQMAMFCKEIETGKSDYVSKAKAIELGSELF